MRRLALISALVLGAAAWLATTAGGQGGPSGDYLVRAYFDNAGFLVKDEEVRVAGANVGTVKEVDVSRQDEPVTEDGSPRPGKAVAVLTIDDPAFQDFREDASCLIRPQSLLGEKFVECRTTSPRSASGTLPPPLETIGEGEIGEGQLYLPLENNGKAVDLDLLNNVTREPEIDRFRLILNDLGAGLAARGEDLSEVLRRANPALRELDEVLAILAEQNKGLAQLARDSDTILGPLSRERDAIAGFINNAATTGEAAAERRADIEAGFEEFPEALAELEPTMVELRRFAEAGTPVAADLRVAAPSFGRSTEALAPFSRAATKALLSLGDAAVASGPDLAASAPLIRDLGTLGQANTPGARNLKKALKTLRKTGGLDHLYDFILGTTSAINGYDAFGHFLRGSIQINNCTDYVSAPTTGCGAKWGTSGASAATVATPGSLPENPALSLEEGGRGAKTKKASSRAARDLFEFLTGDSEPVTSDPGPDLGEGGEGG